MLVCSQKEVTFLDNHVDLVLTATSLVVAETNNRTHQNKVNCASQQPETQKRCVSPLTHASGE